MYIGMRFHLYIFFTMFCVHSFSVFFSLCLFHLQLLFLNHLTKSDKRGWLTRWPPRSFANPMWHSAPLCLHWSAIVPLLYSHLLYCSLMVGLLHAMAFMVLLLIGWVIWNNKPLPLPLPTRLMPSILKTLGRLDSFYALKYYIAQL